MFAINSCEPTMFNIRRLVLCCTPKLPVNCYGLHSDATKFSACVFEHSCDVKPYVICHMYCTIFLLPVADENAKDKAGRQIIHHAVMGGSVFLVHYLFIVNEQDLDVS